MRSTVGKTTRGIVEETVIENVTGTVVVEIVFVTVALIVETVADTTTPSS